MTRPTFLLGLGCQKGGTSWLHAYLRFSPEVAVGLTKEYHIWDVLDLPSPGRVRQQVEAAAAAGDPKARRRVEFWADPDKALDYFADLLSAPQIRLATDITPAYAGLSAERLRWLREGFQQRGIDAKAVFLMRDPVERIWSAERMHVLNYGGKPAEQRILASYARGFHMPRTHYDLTMAALDAAFPQDAVHYGFFEELFTTESIRSLCEFVGISYREPKLGRARNVSPKAVDLPDETSRLIATHYRDVYVTVAERFGAERVRGMWPSSVHVLA